MLDDLQDRVKRVHVTLPFRRELYALRTHIAFVAQGIRHGDRLQTQGSLVGHDPPPSD
jgi:hypothetical protein